MFKNSIRLKIVAIIMLINAVVMLIALIADIIYDINTIKKRTVSQLIFNVTSIGEDCIIPLEFNYHSDANKALTKLGENPQVTLAILFNANNKIFARYGNTSLSIAGQDIPNARKYWYNGEQLHLFEPIVNDQHKIGVIYVEATTNISALIRDRLTLAIIIFWAMMLISLLIASKMQKIISLPILTLANVADQVSKNEDYSIRVKHNTNDEIGILYNKFNYMLSVIENREQERDTALNKVKTNQDQLKAIINNSGAIVYLKNTDNQLLIVNNQFLSFFNVYYHNIALKNEAEVLTPAQLPKFSQYDNKILSEKQSFQFESTIKVNDNEFSLLINRFPIFNYQGNVQSICCIATDISEIKNTQYELERYRNHLEELVKLRTTEIEKINAKLQQTNHILKETNTELEEKNKQIEAQKSELQKANEELETQKNYLQETLSELRNTQSQLIQSEKMASLGVLTAGIAHEINNPINYISSGIEGVKLFMNDLQKILEYCANLQPNKKEALEKIIQLSSNTNITESLDGINKLMGNIKTGVKRTTEIIKGLKTFSRSNDDRMSFANIHELIDSTLVILHSQYKNHIKIIKKYDNIKAVKCYPGKLNQVFMNLLVNAIQAIQNTGKIEISTQQNSTNITIIIKDNGIGIPENEISRVFEPFYSTKLVGEGTGLGLSISYAIIEQHKGNITINSKINKGTEFIIQLPNT